MTGSAIHIGVDMEHRFQARTAARTRPSTIRTGKIDGIQATRPVGFRSVNEGIAIASERSEEGIVVSRTRGGGGDILRGELGRGRKGMGGWSCAMRGKENWWRILLGTAMRESRYLRRVPGQLQPPPHPHGQQHRHHYIRTKPA